MDDDHMEKFNIMPDCRLGIQLCLKSDHEEQAAMTSALGKERFWSSAHLHSHLEVLQSLVPNVVSTLCHPSNLCMHIYVSLYLFQSAESAHTWIDPFFFRVSAMVPSDQGMILSVEQVIQQRAKLPSTGYIDYTAVIANNNGASELDFTLLNLADELIELEYFLDSPTSTYLSILKPSVFFLAVPKIESATLLDHVPQAVREMYACAKKLK
jgi:hypothetical protein